MPQDPSFQPVDTSSPGSTYNGGALANTLRQRLQDTRNPNVSTDQGQNSGSPYFLGATPMGVTDRIRNLSSSWSTTGSLVSAYDQQATAKVATEKANIAAQAAAKKALALAKQMQAGAIAADASHQKQLAQLRQAAGQYATDQMNFSLAAARAGEQRGVKGGAGGRVNTSGPTSSKGGIDAESRAMYNHAINNGYAGRVSLSSYSKTYNYDPTLDKARNKALALATSYLGTNYVLGGESQSGIDCSGLVQVVYRQLGFNVPTHSAADQGQTGGRAGNGRGIPGVKTSIANLKPGDLVAWRDGSHIAIYAGNGEIIEAANTRVGTVRRKLWASESAVVGIHLNI